MASSLISGQGRMTAYVDQNVLDLFVKGKALDFKSLLTDKFQVVYSDETLGEIERSGHYASQFLDVLVELNAAYIKIQLDDNFQPIGKAHIWLRSPYEALAEYCDRDSANDAVQDSISQFLLKFSGGRVGDKISDIHDEQKNAFGHLMASMRELASEVEDDIPGLSNILAQHSNIAQKEYHRLLDEIEVMLSKDIDDEENWSGIKSFRGAVGLGPKELKNLEPPHILEKIWDLYKEQPPYNELDFDLDDFFGISQNPINSEQPLYLYQKVSIIYQMLNTLGYYQDSNIKKERRFIASMSDQGHVEMASFTHAIFSGDEDLIKKAAAAYEYLKIPTQAVHVTVKKK